MRDSRGLRLLVAALVAGFAGASHAGHRDLGRETLAPDDGWASANGGTTGGAAAVPGQVWHVTNRAELIAALNDGVSTPTSPANPSSAPKIVYVDGVIDGNVDDANAALSCADYYRPDPTTGEMYSLEAFLAAYDPDGPWGRVSPSGPQERARAASASAQSARVRIRVGSNTTIVGVGRQSGMRGVWLDVRGSGTTTPRSNVIIRNLTFEDTYDCFPVWAPTDGATGNWNAAYDSISLAFARNVWVDHNAFRDAATHDSTLPTHFGRLYQVHDGLLDITNASDFVTVSWNVFEDHDKTMLIGANDSGSSTTGGSDAGRLRTTIHHNAFDAIGQRAPRVRFGQVHVYDNYYRVRDLASYGYSWGVGVNARIVAEENAFRVDEAVTPDLVIDRFGTNPATTGRITATGTRFDGPADRFVTDVVAAWNAANDPDLGGVTDFDPVLHGEIESARHVPASVLGHAGPFPW